MNQSVKIKKYNVVVSKDLSARYIFSWNNTHFFSHHGKSGIFVVGVEVTKATVETDMLGNDFH